MSSADDRENGKTTALPGLAGPLVRGMPIHELELAPGALCRTAANKLAAVTARAANAPTGLIHLAHAGRLWIAGGSGLPGGWEAMGPASARSTLAGWVIEQGVPMIVTDVLTDRRVPADAPMRGAGFRAYAGFPIHDRNDAIVGVCAVLDLRSRDWTVGELAGVDEGAQACTAFAEQQQASAEADRQRRFLDALLDSLRTGVAACDPDGRPVFTNAAMRAIADELPADADLETWLDRVPLADSNGIPVTADAAPLVRALRGERIRDAELRLRGPADRPVIMLADAQPITGLGGEPLGAVLTLRDVTEQRRAERFARAEQTVAAVLAGAQHIHDAAPAVVQAVAEALGSPHAELWLVERDVLVPVARHSTGPDPAPPRPQRLQPGQGLAGRAWQTRTPQWMHERPDTTQAAQPAGRRDAALAVPICSGEQVHAVLTLFTDTLDDPEEQLVALLSGIAAHLGQFLERRRADELALALTRTKDEYLALVGHDLRTPITSMISCIELLRDLDPQTLAAESAQLLDVAARNSEMVRHIVDELLDLAALDSGHAVLAREPLDLSAVVHAAAEAAQPAAAAAGVVLHLAVEPCVVLDGDAPRLRQVVTHLLDNAIRHSIDGGHITVTLARTGNDTTQLTVTDTGLGVPPEEHGELFTRFYRSTRTRDHRIPGAGLGLAISRAIIHRHHGDIRMIPTDGPGTRIAVRLPAQPEARQLQ
ncbi:GAF domain-containing protein [Dactylosporangium vinaceum]|uniref:histidine kinase n=1 Tax=Dactylosporangium vinaceum TaxID=53362 RepID=A0ABV5MSE1_9ACTN|nr:ATP-binding protein [Dactylosporangium vinaceum]UAC00173.1 GAF domain-containing protein [Dactylosporangium vinaceum]